jgi:hypothetical protein
MNINTDKPITINNYRKPSEFFEVGLYLGLGIALAVCVTAAVICTVKNLSGY